MKPVSESRFAGGGPPASRGHRFRWRLTALICALLVGVVLGETVARLVLDRGEGPFAHNPIIQKQAQQVDFFESDPELGHRLRGGGFVGVYQQGIISIEHIIGDQRRTGRTFVLNIGDSSTSGWDSNVIVGNALRQQRGEALKSPFQDYPTYSDLLAKDPKLYVVNAGVPGFSSLQGARYLKRILSVFSNAGVRVDVVTIYFGNNDSAWNGNISDRYLVPGARPPLHLVRLLDQASQRWRLVPRVNPQEYGVQLRAMIEQSAQAGAKTVVIEPVIPRMWPPGLRAMGLDQEVVAQLARLNGVRAGQLLQHSRELFEEGMTSFRQGNNVVARQRLEEARELDYLVPRIKTEHAKVLRDVARAESVPLVSVGPAIPLDDSKYFVDYCHPVEPANELIASAIRMTVGGQ